MVITTLCWASPRLVPHLPRWRGTSRHHHVAPSAAGRVASALTKVARRGTCHLQRQADSCPWESVCLAAGPPSSLATLVRDARCLGKTLPLVTWVKTGWEPWVTPGLSKRGHRLCTGGSPAVPGLLLTRCGRDTFVCPPSL